jgi:tetratricopeptide (TPR) repeat protein
LQQINKNIIFVLLGAFVIFVLLILSPKINPEGSGDMAAAEHGHHLESHLADFKKSLSAGQLAEIEGLEAVLAKSSGIEKIKLIDSLARLWDLNKLPVASAIVFGQKLEFDKNDEVLFEASEKYFFASRYAADSHLQEDLVKKAAAGYEEILKRKPTFADAKISLAVCLVEGSIEPMRGIGLLREVLEADPENIKANINLGYFSIKSGQYDKAIERFERVIEINPDYPEAYLYLGDVYETKGDIEKAVNYFTLYSQKVNNPVLQQEISRYVEKLKTK